MSLQIYMLSIAFDPSPEPLGAGPKIMFSCTPNFYKASHSVQSSSLGGDSITDRKMDSGDHSIFNAF